MTSSSHTKKRAISPAGGDRKVGARGSGSGGVSIGQLVKGGLFGVIFGFLLGALLLEDFTVMKVMLTAIIVGGAGIFGLHALGLVELRIKPTRYASNSIGGLLFGIGFGLLGYCPGTGAAALGQGNWDVIAGIVGLMVGSYLFAEFSGTFDRTIDTWGARGRLTLPELVGARRSIFLVIWLPLLTLALVAMHRLTVR
jgi:uncharacterized membrane protein YedE/YeeE